MTWAGLWLFAAVAALSIAAQNVFWFALAGWLGRRLWVQGRLPSLPAWGWVWVAFMAWALLASLLSDNAAHSLFTWRKWLLAVAAWCVADAIVDQRHWRALAGTLLLSAALVNLAAALWFGSLPLLAWAQGQPWSEVAYHWVHDTEWRARGGSGGYMVLAGVDVLLLGFYGGLLSFDRQWRRPLVWACLGAIALGLLLTMTRGAWLAAALSLGVLLLRARPRLALAGLLLGLAFLAAFPQSVFSRRLVSVTDRNNDSNRERWYMAQVGAKIVQDRPWLGVGDALHSWQDAQGREQPGWFLRLRSPEALAWYKSKNVPQKDNGHLHNTPLQWAAMYGLPGALLASAFFVGLMLLGWRVSRDGSLTETGRGAGLGLAAALLGLGAHSLTEYNLGSFQTSFTLWFVIGLAVAGVRLAGKAER